MANAGWHPDPTGRHGLRYHDGELWTSHVADGGVQALDPMVPALPGPPPMPGPPSMPPPGWGTSGWGLTRTREHPDGTTVLVLGILSLVVCGLLGPFAWSKGSRALTEMDREPHTMWSNRGQIRAGQICGIISSCLLAFSAAIFVLVVIAAAAGSN